jgi:uncharacterized membrane protein
MTKTKKITYWIATVWLALGMVSTGLVQLIQQEEQMKDYIELGYPLYFLTLLGTWKILGSIALLVPKFPLVKEWAYAGFFFAMTGAAYSHIAHGSPFGEIAPSLFLLVLTLVSWYTRPANRKVVSTNQ